MPHRDPAARKKKLKDWNESRTPAYHRWLYARRKLRFDKAEAYEKLLRVAADGNGLYESAARELLDEMDARERAIGNEFDHDLDHGVWVG